MTDLQIPPHEYLTVRELADLLRLKERKIYDLAASGEVPCSRATGKLLFPASEIRAWIEGAQSGGFVAAPVTRPGVFLGSHDPLLDWAIRQSRCGLATYFDGSLDGLTRFAAGEGVATGLHVRDANGDWNTGAARTASAEQNAVLVGFAARRRGLVLREDGPTPRGLADLAGLRLAPRQDSSGTAGLLRDLAAEAGLDLGSVTLTPLERTEDEAVQSVRRGEADVTFGLESVAHSYGLRFVPVIEERFDLLLDRKAWFDPPLQTLIAFCRSETFRARAGSLGGYDLSRLGEVVWNA
ncbi:helix-turn-helix transcriptional regulator [Alloyangia pacifica]|uniref:DNA binding domain-containing protein, excisionase family n=1 Tax=Alloyangia pacifica TaxID=311180 RepID=A0A1I6T5N2_9RHOB|nr:helix-turn-helix transcriptional regulator [Alloyangia pacifica]SDG98339.1 DNA binding domain-containing protein, excisionase family [Alloyangia pacifica]SFS84338.1 DNA binding domain-containing protein, excisionase family [Alloyangia pacifica]